MRSKFSIHVVFPQTLSELTELLSSYSNYSNYRRVYNDCTGFKVPILGVHLKDLISLNEALPDYLEDDKINLGKLQHLYSNISDLLAIHDCTPPFEANKDLLHLLTVRQRENSGLSDLLSEKCVTGKPLFSEVFVVPHAVGFEYLTKPHR